MIEASGQFIQWRLAGGNPQQAVQIRKEGIDQAIEEQKAGVLDGLERKQANFQNQVRPILAQMADISLFEAQMVKVAALERKVKQLEAVQQQLLIAIQEKSDQIERLKLVVRNLIQELQALQGQIGSSSYASQEQDLIRLGGFVCQGIAQKGEKYESHPTSRYPCSGGSFKV